MGDFAWTVQIGPDVEGRIAGVVNSTSAAFLVLPSGTTGQVDAACSTDAGATWQQIPPGEPLGVGGDNLVQWRLAPQGDQVKFLIGQFV